MYLLYQPVDKQLIWYQSPCQRHDVKVNLQDIVKIYNADAYYPAIHNIPTPMGWGGCSTYRHKPWQASCHVTYTYTSFTHQFRITSYTAILGETTGAEDSATHHEKPRHYILSYYLWLIQINIT